MILTEIIARLQAIPSSPFAMVDGAAGLASIADEPIALPAAFVIPLEEASSENQRMTGGVLQIVQADIGVVVMASNVQDATGLAATTDIETLKRAVRTALIGWQPASAAIFLTDIGGRLVRARNGQVWWELQFATSYLLEAT